jgi:hypothetical protein
MFIFGLIGLALESPEDRAKRLAESEAKRAEAVAKEKAEAEGNAKSAKAEAIAWHKEVIETAKACDTWSEQLQSRFSKLRGPGDLYKIYEVASDTKSQCSEAWRAYNRLRIPASMTGEAQEKAEKAKESCSNAYFAKRQFAEIAMEIADGDMKPSKVQEAKEYAKASSSGVILCVTQSMGAVLAAGVTLEELQPSKK